MTSQIITLPNNHFGNSTSNSSIINTGQLTESARAVADCVNTTLDSTRRSMIQSVDQVNWHVVLMSGLLTWICAVSMYDMYWSFKTAAVLAETEQNPIGSWLIALDNGDISLFMTAKALGNVMVPLIIAAIYYYKKNWGMIIASSIAGLQTLLLLYLNFGQYLFPPQIM